MINFAARIEALQTARYKKMRELDGSVRTFSADHMREQRTRVVSDFEAGMAQLNADFQAQEQAMAVELSAARHKAWVAGIGGPDNVARALPGLTGAQLAAVYKNAIAAQDQGVQLAVEFFQPSFSADDRTGGAALLEINSLRAQQQAQRSRKESDALAAVEGKLKSLRDEYSAATLPVVEERVKTQYQQRAAEF